MKNNIIALLVVIPLLISCSQAENTERQTLTGNSGYADSTDQVVQAADGSLYSVGCLQSSTASLQQKGAIALQDCKVTAESGSIETSSTARGKFFTNSYAYVYYPPTYYNPSSYSTYNYYPGYNWMSDNRFRKDPFCNWLSGSSSSNSNYSINWYYLLGYLTGSGSSSSSNNTAYRYTGYYNDSCNTCLYSVNPSACQARCYNTMPIYYY